MKEIDKIIFDFVTRVRRRLREQSVVNNCIGTMCVGFGAGILSLLLSLIVPLYLAFPIALMCVGIGLIYGVIRGIRRAPNMEQAALQVDAKGHKEKISTALYLRGKEDAFSSLQKKDAVKIVNGFSVRKSFPIRVSRKQVLVFFSMMILFVGLSYVDTPAKKIAAVRHEVHKQAKKEIEKLEKVEKELQKNSELSEKELQELKDQIEAAKKEWAKVESKEEEAKLKERVAKKMEMAANEMKNESAAKTLNDAAKEARSEAQSEIEKLSKEALEALEEAKKDGDKSKAYEKMKELAAKTSNKDLSNKADAFKENQLTDYSVAEAKEAVENASNASNAQSNSNSNQMASNDGQTSQNNSQNNSGNNQNSNQNNGQNNGNNQNSNNGQNDQNQNGNQNAPGNQGGQGGQNGQNGAGDQGGNGGDKNSQGGGGAGGGAGWNKGSKDGHEGVAKTREDITIPDGELGNDDNLNGNNNGDKEGSTYEKSNDSKAWAGNKVNYGEVSGEYKKKAYSKMEGSNYPKKMKNKIKNYFDGLN